MNDPREDPFPRPEIATYLARLITPVNHLFDRLYQARYNPLYRSGTLTVGLLAVVMLTGLYLLFFYDVAAPYQSIERIQSQVWLGRWMRALHRYATDACILTVLFHLLQLLIQGRTWGPRTLAWVSGVVLLITLLLSAWTGYVMVWDAQGQLLATSGARMMQLFPLLHDTLGQAFDGSRPVSSPFFFMNLFLHVTLPLGMIFGLWVHTARLARSVWFPIKPIFYVSSLSLFVLSIFWPAPLLPKADLFAVPGVVEVDWFYAFWLPILSKYSPLYALLFWLGLCLLCLSIPWWWRPHRENRPLPSISDEELCSGCRQCSMDCPYEAISMVPRSNGDREHSSVHPEQCVSCGICAASCEQLAIGPPQRKGQDQLARVERFCTDVLNTADASTVVVAVCQGNPGALAHMEKHVSQREKLHLYPIDCVGTLHTRIVENLLERCGGVFVWGCPARNCLTREGIELLNLRSFHKRPPSVSRRIDKDRVALESHSTQEQDELCRKLELFQRRLESTGETKEEAPALLSKIGRYLKSGLATTALVLAIGALSRLPMGEEPAGGIFRLGARIPGLVFEDCRDLTPEELQKLPLHMRRTRECDKVALDYVLSVEVDGRQMVQRRVKHSGVRGDRPLFVNEEIPVPSGEHRFFVSLEPEDKGFKEAPRLQLTTSLSIDDGRIYLVVYNLEEKALQLR